MKKSTIVITVLSATIVLQVVLLCNFVTRFLLLELIDPNDPDDGYILTKDVVLTTGRGYKIQFPAGTTLHGPCRHDLVYTDLGDPRVWKVIIRSDHGELQKCASPLPEARETFLLNQIMNAELGSTQEVSEQRPEPY